LLFSEFIRPWFLFFFFSLLDIPLLGKIPLEPAIARSCDEGKSFITEFPNSRSAIEIQKIIVKIVQQLEPKTLGELSG
jgi:hypothetical protein